MADMHIGYLIKQVFLMNQARLNTIFAEFDLTASQTFTLIYLFKAHERGEQVHQKDIEDAMDISNPSVTGILNRLEHKGLVTALNDEEIACMQSCLLKMLGQKS